MPQQAAGIRTDPPVSVPRATSASPLATTTALPLDEPPGIRSGASGLTGIPKSALLPIGLMHISVSIVLPTMIASDDARIPARHRASDAAGLARARTTALPAVVVWPLMSIASFTATRRRPSASAGRSKRAIHAFMRRPYADCCPYRLWFRARGRTPLLLAPLDLVAQVDELALLLDAG
jgi:hypothetical protein